MSLRAIIPLLCACALPAAGVRINELVASNGTVLVDEDGEFPDWIELHNPGGGAVEVGGWGLSDNPGQPFKWEFPAGVVVEGGGHLLVFASGKDRHEFNGWDYDPGWPGAHAGAAGVWLFDEAGGGSAVADASGNGNAGVLQGGQRMNVGLAQAMKFDPLASEHVSVPNSASLQTTGSMAVAMWLNPAALGRRQNPWDKAYGGEGTITLEANGILNFIWGTAGGNGTPYQGFGSVVPVAAGKWTHVVVVRDLAAGKLRWYLNGAQTAIANTSFPAAVASTAAVRIGRGYAGAFEGMIALPMLLPYAPAAEDVAALYQQTRGAFQPQLHTNFAVSVEGEPLTLTRPDGTVADAWPAVALRRDLAYGRTGHDPEQFRVFEQPTPLAANPADGYLGILPEPVFSTAGGFHENPFDLELSAAGEAEILYTLDGSEPREERLDGEAYGFKSVYPQSAGDPFGELQSGVMTTRRYDGPLEIADRTAEPNRLSDIATWFSRTARVPAGNLRKATVVRARAVKPGYLSSRVVTHSYFVGPDVAGRFNLPVISLTTDDANLFDYERGIYVPGKLADDWRLRSPNYTPATWAIPANYWEGGDAWERPLHFECFTPSGERVFAQDVGARIHGGASRAAYRKSLRLYARESYGGGSMAYPFIPGLERKAFPGQEVEAFERLLLRNSGNDSTGILFLDALLHRLVTHLPIDTQAWQPALHYINGESWGLINFRERLDESYLASHYGVPPEESVILDNWTASLEHGNPRGHSDYQALLAYAEANDAADPAVWAELVLKIDVGNHALYHAFEIYIAHHDWPYNNIRFWKRLTPAYAPDARYGSDGRWRWMIFDTDLGFRIENVAFNSLVRVAAPAAGSSVHTSSRMFRALMKSPEYRGLLINHLADQMNGPFAPQRVAAMIDEFNALLAFSRAEHFQRWQSSGTVNGGQGFRDFAAQRPGHVRQHVVGHFGLAGTYPLTVDCPHPERGAVRVNSLVVAADMPGHPNPSVPYPWTGTYFQGVAVELEAVPKPGYRFAGWADRPEETAARVELTASGPESWTALFEPVPPPVLIHAWEFEAEPFAAPSRTLGGANLTAVLADGAAWLREPADANMDSAHLRLNNPLGAVLEFRLPTTGLTGVTLAFETRRSGQGAGVQTVSYSLDGSVWVPLATYEVADAPAERKSFDFSGIPGVDDNSNFAVRIAFSRSAGQIAAGSGLAGNNRFDRVRLDALPLPGTNLPPEVVAEIGHREIIAGGEPLGVDLGGVFNDPNGVGSLAYAAVVDPPGRATVEIEAGGLVVGGLSTGNAVVTVTADDGGSPPVATSFPLFVHPAPFAVAAGDYVWREWSSQEPAGVFPPNMAFLQGEGNNDSTLATPLTRAYEIPAGDAASPVDVAYPYAATSRTRINGLGAGGLAFVNTGRGRDLGAAVLALDTLGADEVRVSWLAGTVLPNTRVYALRLQAREGLTGMFQDVSVGGQPVEYVRNEAAGHRQVIGPVELPAELLGKEYVQLQWRYHLVSGTSGARAQLSLDDVVVAAGAGFRNYESWRLAEYPGLDERDNDAVSGPLAESEGVRNLLRYAMGVGRSESAVGVLPVLTPHGVFRFRCDLSKIDVVYRVVTSPDLADWSEVLYDSSSDHQPAPVDGFLNLPVDMASDERRFYRLEVVR